MSSSRSLISPSGGPVVLSGYVKKLKTQKKKYFVLRGEAPGYPACLEYYDSKKKYDNRQPPKRSILLDSCFNINRRMDTKHKHVIALYTKDECFCLILETEKELQEWLKAMLLLQGGDVPDGEQPRPIFEHVWQVTMQKKGLGERKNIHGPYRLCLTDRTLSLVKIGAKDNSDSTEFPLICIRRCGSMDRIFYMEVGRSAVTGGGELWMEAEDSNIAQNMHTAIMNAMSNSSSSKEDVGPRQRMRSSSATEASKPIFVLQHRQAGQKFHNSPLEEHRTHEEQMDPVQEQEQSNQTQSTSSCITVTGANGRDRCDSLPSRARTTSESHPTSILSHPRSTHFVPHVLRPHSMYVRGLSYSPPIASMPISPGASGTCSTDSAGSSLSMDDGGEGTLEESTMSRYGHSLTPDEPVILEENGDDYAPWSTSHSHHKYSPNFKSHSPSQQSSYIEMNSPSGSSPGRSGGYMQMNTITGHSHSRASSLVEESNTLPEGYVPMAPGGNNGYVDMDPTHNHNGHFPDDLSHGGSSCSVTSGTPSTDLRFSEYHLDKVISFLPPGDDMQARPARAYSIGSRPEPANRHRKNRLDIAQQDASRVRAFSVGSKSKRPEIGRLVNVVTAPLQVGSENSTTNKSNSAPLLSSSWGHNSGCSVNSERMEDLMELDFTKPSISTTFNSPPSSYSQSQSQSHSYSTATDTSSYVDMSPGQPPSSTTAAYVDMSRINKINRNNNNNTITANQNHSHIHVSSSASTHKPVITTLKPVEEAEGPYMRMDGVMEDWSQSDTSPKQISSPMQEECVQSNGPPGVTRTAPVDLPRRPPADYVDMNFKSRTSLEQDYINMNMSNRNNRKPITTRTGSRKEKLRSQPIAIQAGNKPIKTPSFLPLNGSPESESLASTPASPPRATPTGSSATIFPFSLNSPQSPEKSFTHQNSTNESSQLNVTSKTGNERTILEDASSRVGAINSVPITETNNTLSKDRPPSPTGMDSQINRVISNNSLASQDNILNAVTKKFTDLSVSKPRLITASPNTSPTLSGFKPNAEKQPPSPKLLDETPTPTPTATPSPLEKESFDKAQDGAEILHYASLDLPEVGNTAPVSPASQEGFNYAEIDFAKLKQN
ncbi:insulin receptor substrate 1 chico isoform X4 [Xylocopa sonorina]|uniref:insulin receptor substrate 1 chico isoform X4 n=1 Tax=Xylocopa sonorina TaxID=1818115 RepID=UPI00403ACB83